MSFLVCSFLSLILSSFRHHHVFSKVRKHCFGLFQKRSQMLHSTHEGPLAQIWSPARKRMNDRKKKKKKRDRHSRNKQIHSTEQYWRRERGFRFPSFFFFLTVIVPLNKCHIVWPAQGNRQHPAAPLPSANKSDRWPASVAAEGSPRWPSCSWATGFPEQVCWTWRRRWI